MIDSRYIVAYTNGLYTTTPENAPRYDEFRDMFSSGQVFSKQWAVKELSKLNRITTQTILIAGSWFGTLGLMLKYQFPNSRIVLLDIDPRCEKYIKNVMYNYPDIIPLTGDMYNYNYIEPVVINTSCEHIQDVRGWLDLLPKETLVLLQSNDFTKGQDHVNCVNSENEFKEQTKLSNIFYSGKLETPMYTRYMLIGTT